MRIKLKRVTKCLVGSFSTIYAMQKLKVNRFQAQLEAFLCFSLKFSYFNLLGTRVVYMQNILCTKRPRKSKDRDKSKKIKPNACVYNIDTVYQHQRISVMHMCIKLIILLICVCMTVKSMVQATQMPGLIFGTFYLFFFCGLARFYLVFVGFLWDFNCFFCLVVLNYPSSEPLLTSSSKFSS